MNAAEDRLNLFRHEAIPMPRRLDGLKEGSAAVVCAFQIRAETFARSQDTEAAYEAMRKVLKATRGFDEEFDIEDLWQVFMTTYLEIVAE